MRRRFIWKNGSALPSTTTGATTYRFRSSSNRTAPACGEIILELLELLGVTLTRQMAEALYLAISTDTGCFKYSNTTAHTHEAAAKLIAAGAEVYPINKAFFDTKSFARLQLEARLTDSIELYDGGIVGLCTMPKSLFNRAPDLRGRRRLHLRLCPLDRGCGNRHHDPRGGRRRRENFAPHVRTLQRLRAL